MSVHSWNENTDDDADDPKMGWSVNDHLGANHFGAEEEEDW